MILNSLPDTSAGQDLRSRLYYMLPRADNDLLWYVTSPYLTHTRAR